MSERDKAIERVTFVDRDSLSQNHVDTYITLEGFTAAHSASEEDTPYYLRYEDGRVVRWSWDEGTVEVDPDESRAARRLDLMEGDENQTFLTSEDGTWNVLRFTLEHDLREHRYQLEYENFKKNQVATTRILVDARGAQAFRDILYSLIGDLYGVLEPTGLLPEGLREKTASRRAGNGTTRPEAAENGRKIAEDAVRSLLEVVSSVQRKPSKREIVGVQKSVCRNKPLEYTTSQTVNSPFIMDYEPNRNEFVRLRVNVAPRSSREKVFNHIWVKGPSKLNYFHWLVFLAYRICVKENPDEPVTVTDIINRLYVSKSGNPLRPSHCRELSGDVIEALQDLRTTGIIIDFKNEAELYERNGEYRRYLEDGGDGRFALTFIRATVGPVKTANGRIVDGVASDPEWDSYPLEAYIQMSKQIRIISENLLANPLSATKENIEIYHYFREKISAMPYGDARKRLLEKKLKHLKSTREIEREIEDARREIESMEDGPGERDVFGGEDPGAGESLTDLYDRLDDLRLRRDELEDEALRMAEIERKIPEWQMTISLDSLMEDLGLKDDRKSRNETKNKAIRVLESLKGNDPERGEEWIKGYRVNPKSNGRGAQSFSVRIFSDLKESS